MFVKVEGVKGAVEAGFEVPQHGVDPEELRQVVGVLSSHDHCLVLAVGNCHGAEAGEVIGEHLTAGSQITLGPISDRSGAETTHGGDPGVNRMTGLVHGDSSDDRQAASLQVV